MVIALIVLIAWVSDPCPQLRPSCSLDRSGLERPNPLITVWQDKGSLTKLKQAEGWIPRVDSQGGAELWPRCGDVMG